MSVIQRIRDRGAWIIFGIIALALIAFILQDGVGRGGSSFSNTSTIGKVNGEKIERGDFEEKLALQEQMYAGQGATRDQLRWDRARRGRGAAAAAARPGTYRTG